MMKIYRSIILVIICSLLLTSCSKDDEQKEIVSEETPPCFNTDMEISRNPFLQEIEYTVDEQVAKVDYVTVIRIDSFIEESTDINDNPNSLFQSSVLENLKANLQQESILEANVFCVHIEKDDTYIYLSRYGFNMNPDDYFREGNYYLALTKLGLDNELLILYFRELPNYNEYISLESQSQLILDIVQPYINAISGN